MRQPDQNPAMFKPIAAVLAFALALGTWFLPVAAQPRPKVFHIGLLSANALATNEPHIKAFRDVLHVLGYDEGRNLVIDMRFAAGAYDKLPAMAAELAALKVDVFFTITEPALLAAKEAGRNIPIVTVTCNTIERLVGSLARPGGNATGFSCVSSDLVSKRLGLLKTFVPTLSRAAMLYYVDGSTESDLKEAEAAAQTLGVTLVRYGVRSADELVPAFDEMARQNCGALYIASSGFTNLHRQTLAQLALDHHLPAIYGFREFADDGGLLAYGASLNDAFQRAAYYVDKVLKGAKPSDLPAEEPTRFELVVNAKTAAALGMKIPDLILVQANEVLE
jgi:putative ABC transport system substrate-binding protein